MAAQKETAAVYMTDNAVIAQAISIIEKRLKKYETVITSPSSTKEYLTLLLAEEKKELFMVMYLTSQHHLITAETLFTGTIDSCSVYPREVVIRALEHNAAAVILAHNHPSGVVEPSAADRHLTTKITTALGTVDIRIIDHVIVGGTNTLSFAERGYL